MPYTFLDVETPNGHNRRICSIGVVRTDDSGSIEHQQHFLVNPEEHFDQRNIHTHGLTPATVADAPTFKQLWPDLAALFEDTTLVAHQATFDFSVLAKCLAAYEIPPFGARYQCTKRLAELHRVPVERFSLPMLCAHYSIDLPQHHNALEDALACDRLFWALAADGCDLSSPQHFDFRLGSGAAVNGLIALPKRTIASSMTDLLGIISGLSADHVYNTRESLALHEWLVTNSQYRDSEPFNEVIPAVEAALDDRVLTLTEAAFLVDLVTPFIEDSATSLATATQQLMLGILRGVRADDVINIAEATMILKWLDQQDPAMIPGFVPLRESLRAITADGVITDGEHAHLMALFARLLDPTATPPSAAGSTVPSGVAEANGPLNVAGKAVVLTGGFKFGEKADVMSYIVEHGGEVKSGVSRKVDYVIQGERGSEAYAFGNYGTKIRKALELQDQGCPIRVVKESQLFGTA